LRGDDGVCEDGLLSPFGPGWEPRARILLVCIRSGPGSTGGTPSSRQASAITSCGCSGGVAGSPQCGLVRKEHDTSDRRFVFVYLTRHGEQILGKLTDIHRGEVRRARETLLKTPRTPPHALEFKKKAAGS